jgi:hypothetical protein
LKLDSSTIDERFISNEAEKKREVKAKEKEAKTQEMVQNKLVVSISLSDV